jgi:hypothetical protein
MKEYAELITAIAQLLWPVAGVTVVLLFRRELSGVLRRFKKGKILGNELELSDELSALERQVVEVVAETPRLLPSPQTIHVRSILSEEAFGQPSVAMARTLGEGKPSGPLAEGKPSGPIDYDKPSGGPLFEESRRGPEGLIVLAARLERAMRRHLAATGGRSHSSMTPLPAAFTRSVSAQLPSSVLASVASFWKVRNRIVHGHDVAESDFGRAVAAGETLLKAIEGLPRERNFVHDPGAEVFEDAAGEFPRPGVLAVVLRTVAVDGTYKHRVFPTTRTDYRVGQELSWDWNPGRTFPESWYRNPDTGQVEYAWTGALEFVGDDLDTI